jgi:hypothetical protein
MLPISFQQRKLHYLKGKRKTIDVNQKRAHYLENVNHGFDMFRRASEDYGIKQEDIWNVAELSFMIGMGKDNWVLT